MLTGSKSVARAFGALAGVALLLAGCGWMAGAPGVDGDPTVSEGDWPNYGRDGKEQHFSPLEQISLDNIDRLSLAWSYEVEPGYSATAPIEADGKLFVTTGHSHIRAFDAATGEELWEYDSRTREIAQSPVHFSWGSKGIAYYKGRIFLATTDGRVIALDANTGKPAWEEREFALDEMRNITGPPRVFDGKVIIGHGGADISPIRGYVTAYDAMSGKRLWRFYTVPGDPTQPAGTKAEEVMRPTWKGDWYGKGGGGTAWNSFSYDAELGLIYIGVGNGYPYNQDLRSPGGGDNLFLASIVAVHADTGEYAWHYQVCPAEQWDCTATMDMTIATIDIDGKPRKVVMQAPKNGFFYVLDAATGEFISAEKIAKVTWAERIDPATGRPVENPGIRYQKTGKMFELWPGPQGAHSWLPQAFSPQTGLVYIPVIDMGALIGPPAPGQGGLGAGMGATLIPDANLPGSRRSYLKAWDPKTQKAAWTVDLPGVWPGGVLATGGQLVFQGRMDHRFAAYNATTGKEVWSFKTAAPVIAPPISFEAGGRQYVTVITGNSSQGAGILGSGNAAYRTDYRLPRHILTFALDGKATPPPTDTPDLVALDDKGFVPDAAKIRSGAMAFAGNGCIVCHGMNAVGGGAAPDLRYSPIILDESAWTSVVHDGALKPNGMPAYAYIPGTDLEAMRHYLRLRAAQAPAEDAAARAGKRMDSAGAASAM